jgi:hypothetical protein
MALQSPGVEVTVIDESFYTPAEPGTTPLIVVATAENKLNAAGTSTAEATLKANAGKAYKLVSQKDVLDLYGVPFFEKTASSSPIHGSERNEYGLLAAYSFLGVSNGAFIVRADIDLSQLEAQADEPGANPTNGQWWIDTQATAWGIQEWNGAAASTTGGQKFATKIPLVFTDDNRSKISGSGAPNEAEGSIGDYAVVFETVDGTGSFSAGKEFARVYYKSAGGPLGSGVDAGNWVLVGSPDWAVSHATVKGESAVTLVGGTIEINGTPVTINAEESLSAVASRINTLTVPDTDESRGVFAKVVSGRLYLYTNAVNDSRGDSTKSNSITITGETTVLGPLGLTAGTYYGPTLQQTPHTQVPQWKLSGAGQIARPTGSVWIKTTEPNQGARWRVKRWNSASTSWVSSEAYIYSSTNAALFYLDRSGGGAALPIDTLFVQTNADEHSGYDDTPETASFRIWRKATPLNSYTTIASKSIKTGTIGSTGSKSFAIAESIKGQVALSNAITVTFEADNSNIDALRIAAAINAAGFANIEATVVELSDSANELRISHKLGGDFRIIDTNNVFGFLFTPYSINTLTGTANFYTTPVGDSVYDYLVSSWQPLAAQNFKATGDAPLNEPSDGQLWYNTNFSEVDIMVHNGETWVGYRHESSPFGAKNPLHTGYTPVVSASNPFVDGETVTGDLWISTADLENYPTIYRYNADLEGGDDSQKWQLVDKTDQVTEDGVLFADARYGDSGATGNTAALISDLVTNNYLDFDAPDPALYPRGMLLWNLRRSGGNVKRYRNNYIDTTVDNARFDSTNSPDGNTYVSGQSQDGYATDRWVTASANNEDGSGTFGRHAQRSVVTQALKSVVDTSQEIRDEERRNFNIIACPGYPELMSNLVNLNIDRGVTAFVVGDTPLRLKSDATSLVTWGSNANLVTDNGDKGIVTYDEYMGVFYPNGFTTDLGGSNAVVPASHMMLKTIALSDQVSYPWFAPAGTRRGGITNATAVGYIDSLSGEFQTVALNNGQRDTLYDLKINPITFFNGVGLVNYGQKTRARNASALDRINVARLVVYLRSQLNKLARPYIFEPNDKITRDEVKQAVESLLLELVGLRALYDFAVVCDETNNTPTRVDRNELWVDIAIEPVKAIEFIYIPLRVKNTGEI